MNGSDILRVFANANRRQAIKYKDNKEFAEQLEGYANVLDNQAAVYEAEEALKENNDGQ